MQAYVKVSGTVDFFVVFPGTKWMCKMNATNTKIREWCRLSFLRRWTHVNTYRLIFGDNNMIIQLLKYIASSVGQLFRPWVRDDVPINNWVANTISSIRYICLVYYDYLWKQIILIDVYYIASKCDLCSIWGRRSANRDSEVWTTEDNVCTAIKDSEKRCTPRKMTREKCAFDILPS